MKKRTHYNTGSIDRYTVQIQSTQSETFHLLSNEKCSFCLQSATEFTHHCYYDSSGEINQESLIAPLKNTRHTH